MKKKERKKKKKKKKRKEKERKEKERKEKERNEKERNEKEKFHSIKSVNKVEFNGNNKNKKEDLFDYQKQKLNKYFKC